MAQAVSWALAEQTGYWHDYGSAMRPGGQPDFDFGKLDAYVRRVKEHNRGWSEWFESHAIAPLIVMYEECVADMAGATSLILRFLGLELPFGYMTSPVTRPLADDVNLQWASRYRALSPTDP